MITIIRKSIKQILRSPFKVLLFFCVLFLSTVILLMGVNLRYVLKQKIHEVENTFTTLGTVQQTDAESYPTMQLWYTGAPDDKGNSKGAYVDYFFPSLDPLSQQEIEALLPVEILQFDKSVYEMEPVKRPYYGATSPDIKSDSPTIPWEVQFSVVEFIPYETAIPSVPTKVKVSRVVSGHQLSQDIYLCDHYNENPVAWTAGKTYIAYLTPLMALSHPDDTKLVSEYSIYPFPKYGSPYSKNCYYAEVTDGFYETPEGKSWLELGEALQRKFYSFNVVPTDSLELLPSFHGDQAPVHIGREITQEEFESGAKVCILPSNFMLSQDWHIGDRITLQMYYADYRVSAGLEYGKIFSAGRMNLLDSSGKAFESFWEEEYEIVGAYNFLQIRTEPQDSVELGENTIIVPKKSIQVSDEKNISEIGPMLWTNCSFIIPNGTADAFMERLETEVPEWNRLEIILDDGGYSNVIEELRNMSVKSILLLMLGIFTIFVTILLLVYFFVAKQRYRIGIERCLGTTKQQCRVSILTGLLALCFIAFTAGFIFCFFVFTPQAINTESYEFSTAYSNWEREELPLLMQNETPVFSFPISFVAVAIPFAFVITLSLYMINRYLHMDPLYLIDNK